MIMMFDCCGCLIAKKPFDLLRMGEKAVGGSYLTCLHGLIKLVSILNWHCVSFEHSQRYIYKIMEQRSYMD